MDQQNPFLKLAQPTSANPFSAPQKVEPTVQTNPFLGLKAPAPAPVTTQKYFAAVDNTGSYGFSDEFDASGRPFFAYRNVGDTSTTTDRTRVATPFDPRAAKPVTRDDFYNPRAVENRAELKKQMGGDYSDELDHRIALALSGSNDTQNLKNIPKEENQSYGKLERAYQEKVIKGELSLFDAQVQMARAKKMQDPWTGDKLPEDSITGNYLNAISNAISGTTAKLFFDKTGGFMKEAPTKGTKVPLNKQVINPSQKKESTEEIRNTPEKKIPGGAVSNVVYNMYKDTKAAIDDEADRIVELFKSSEKGVADRVSGLLNVAAGAANIGFSPVSSILEQAKNAPDQVIRMKNGETIAIPSAGKGAAQGISFLFEKVAEGSKEEVKQVLKVLPFSDETKQKIEPALTEIATLINGLVLGEAAPRAIPRVKEITRNVGEVLKKEAVKISKIPGKEGGYIKNPFEKEKLEQEATKYKSAEEFVKAKSEPLYEFNNYKTIKDKYIARGTVKEAINDIGGIKNVSRGTVYVSDLVKTENVNLSSERARQVSREVKSGVITPLVINEYGEVLDGHHRLAIYKELGIKEIPVIAPKGTEFVKPISKSQLTEIWEKANKDKGATAEADINKLVATKDVAEVKKILKDDFNYPQSEIDKVAPVIAKLSSPRNIKSILEGFDTKAPRIESAPTKIGKQSPARDLAMTEVSMRFETAEKGSRVFTAQEKGGGSDVTAIRSSFPDFISEDLRSRELFDKVLPYYEKGIRPKTARLGRLYDEMQKATDQFERQYEFETTGKLLEPAQKLEKQIATKEKVYKKKPTETGKKELATLKKQSEVIKSAKKEATASARTTQKELQTKQTEEKKAIVDQRSKVIENTYKDVPPIDQETALFQSLADQLASKSDDVKSLPEIIATKATSVKEKVNLFDRFLKTPDRVLEKIGLKKEADLVRHSYESYITELPAHIDLIKEWKEQVTPEGNKKIFKFLDGQLDFAKDPLTKVEAKIAGEIKEYLSDWAERLGLPDDARLSNYITHIFEEDFIKKEFDEDLAKIIQEKIPGQVYDPFLEKRLGAKGYVEDTFRAVQAYAKRAVRKSNMDPALAALKEASKNLEQSQFNYVKEYADRVNMRPTEVDNLLDNGIKQVIGYKLGERPTATITKTLRQMTSRGAFGLNFGTALRNLTQGVNTYSKLGEKYTAIGYTKLLTEWNNKELVDSGILKQDIIQDKTVTALNKNLERIDKGLFYMFETAEKINRGAAYFGAKAKAIAEGKSELEAIQYAKKVVRDTQFQFGSIDTPVGLQSDVAKTLTQFGTFSVKQLEFLKEMGTNKEWAGLIRYALASTLIVATVGNAFNIKAQDFIPLSYFSKFGTPPSFRLPLEIVKAIIDTPDTFGKPRDMEKKANDVLNSAITYAPAGAQIQKTYRGLSAYEDGKVEKTPGNLVKAALLGKTNLTKKQETDPLIKEAADKKKQTASDFRPTYNKVQGLIKQGKTDEAKAIVDNLSDKDYETYKTFKQIEKTKDTTKKMNEMVPTYKKVQDLVKSGKTDEAKAIVEAFSDEEYRVYQLLKKRLSE